MLGNQLSNLRTNYRMLYFFVVSITVCVEDLADIKFGDLGANTGWLTFSLANQLS